MKNEQFALQLSKYYDFFKNEQKLTNKSKNTIISYNTTISSFIDFILQYERKVNFSNFKKMDIMNFLEYKNMVLEKQSELKISSKKLYITHLKTFFSFINEYLDEEMKISSIFKINIRLPKRTPQGIESKDLKKLETYINSLPKENFQSIKSSLLLKILLYSGARRSELENIKTNDFIEDSKVYIIHTIGKGEKERILYIPKKLIKYELEYYLKNGILNIATTKHGKVMDGSQIYRLLNNHYKKAGIKYTGVHILRHTFAKNLVAKDVNIINVKELLGHENIQTTMIYTNPAQKQIQKAYESILN